MSEAFGNDPVNKYDALGELSETQPPSGWPQGYVPYYKHDAWWEYPAEGAANIVATVDNTFWVGGTWLVEPYVDLIQYRHDSKYLPYFMATLEPHVAMGLETAFARLSPYVSLVAEKTGPVLKGATTWVARQFNKTSEREGGSALAALRSEAGFLDFSASTGGKAAKNPEELVRILRMILKRKAGFADEGVPYIVDNSLGVNPQLVAAGLRANGFNARSVREIFGLDPGDAAIKGFADKLGGRVIAADKGHQIGGGFGQATLLVDGRVKTVDSVIRLVKEASNKGN